MSDQLDRTVGIATLPSLQLESGGSIDPLRIAYETYGSLDASGSNAILICHALTGSAHAAGLDDEGKPGWWDGLIGPGRALDTTRFFVICSNVIGSCYGSSGPLSIDPVTGSAYGESFPAVTMRDMVHAQRVLLDSLGVTRLTLVIGGSMGGMQVLEWGLLYPELVGRLTVIASSARHSPWAIAFNTIAREAITLGRNAGDIAAGLGLARKVAMMTYRSGEEFAGRFDRNRSHGEDLSPDGFFVNNWLEHHARALIGRFDSRAYELLTVAMDLHDITRGRGDLATVLRSILQPVLVVGIRSDQLYPVEEQRSLASALHDATYREIDAASGHDAFLIEVEQVASFVREFLLRSDSSDSPELMEVERC